MINQLERKKPRESSLDLCEETGDDTNVFSEGIESPRFASILYDCLKSLDSKVNEIYVIYSSTRDVQIKGAEQLEDVSETIKFTNGKFEEYEADRKQKEKEIAKSKEDLVSLKKGFSKLTKH